MWLEIVLLLISLLLLVYFYATKSFGKWQSLGIPHSKGYFPFGSYNLLEGKHISVLNADDHKNFASEKYFGWFLLGGPVLGINDVNLLKHIQVKDFNHFMDRIPSDVTKQMSSGGDTDKLWEGTLTAGIGEHWKEHRSLITPIFTSGKMKGMLKFIMHIAGDLTDEIEKKAKNEEEFELKDVFGKFSLDTLTSSVFGVKTESFTNKNSKFVEYAAELSKKSNLENAVFLLKFIPGMRQLFSWLKLNTTKPKATKFFRDIVLQTIRTRKESKERRNDLVDLMLDCIKDDSPVDDKYEESDQYEKDMKLPNKKKSKHEKDELTIVSTFMDLLEGQQDTTSTALSYLAYELTKNPEVQKTLQEEIDQAFYESGGEIPDYNVIQNLPFLEMVIYETLRVHPPAGINFRVVNKDYNLPGTDIVLKTNDTVSWNAWSLHFDPEHWTNPTEFYPEHFSKEEKANRSPYAFQAFGQGPRACIGMRFALLTAKVAVLSVLRKFSFKSGTKTKEPLLLDADHALGWVKGGLWVRVETREDY